MEAICHNYTLKKIIDSNLHDDIKITDKPSETFFDCDKFVCDHYSKCENASIKIESLKDIRIKYSKKECASTISDIDENLIFEHYNRYAIEAKNALTGKPITNNEYQYEDVIHVGFKEEDEEDEDSKE